MSAADLTRLVNGFQVTQAIHVMARLGIADLLADGARTSDELAAETDCDADALYRVLRALAGVGVLLEKEGRAFELTPLGSYLRSDSPEPVAGWAAHVGRPYFFQAWANLLHSVKTGETGFDAVHGMGAWEYRGSHPADGAAFDRAMTDHSRRAIAGVVEAHDFSGYGTVVDVGGGQGALLAAVLARNPGQRGVLFDMPQVLDGAGAVLEEAGVADRCRLEEGSFFDSVPEGGDAYLMKSILHDWDDERAREILSVCRRAVSDHSRLLVIERDLGPANEDPLPKLSDLNMLVVLGGRERTAEEYGELFAATGFELAGTTAVRGGLSVIEAAVSS
jgi:hypothetical protein